MTYDPLDPIPDFLTPRLWHRYEDWRGRRHDAFMNRHRHRYTRFRSRSGCRRLLIVLWTALAGLLAVSVFSFLTIWFFVPYFALLIVTITVNRLLRAITGSIGDAPVSALDEIQLIQRNSARSIGFTSMLVLMFIPYFVLIAISMRASVSGQTVYGAAVLQVTLLAVATCIPNSLTALWMNEPEPEEPEPATRADREHDRPLTVAAPDRPKEDYETVTES